MRTTKTSIVTVVILLGCTLAAQVITPIELPDPKARVLQQRHMSALVTIGNDIEAYKFPYRFYFSRALDVDMNKMQAADQRSIRFDFYKGQTVLELTGNYYVAYSADLMDQYARLKETFLQLIMPILRAEVPHFPDDTDFSAFAIEVSHHVRQKSLGISSEISENVTVIIPVAAAQKLVDATSDDQRQAAVLEASVFLNGEPYSLWLQEGSPGEEWKERASARVNTVPSQAAGTASSAASSSQAGPTSVASPRLMNASLTRMPLVTSETLAALQLKNQDAIRQLTEDLNGEAQFLPYAPPVFIGFRQGAYLQLSLETRLNSVQQSSRYKLAALAFDEHVSHLVRPVLKYFPADAPFEGISFSSIVRIDDGSVPVAIEFFFPFRTMRCFASYDCTGQQLIDSGTLVINGERAALELQSAEGKN